jgi:hypothetical protein
MKATEGKTPEYIYGGKRKWHFLICPVGAPKTQRPPFAVLLAVLPTSPQLAALPISLLLAALPKSPLLAALHVAPATNKFNLT